jgi:hypothetical protein
MSCSNSLIPSLFFHRSLIFSPLPSSPHSASSLILALVNVLFPPYYPLSLSYSLYSYPHSVSINLIPPPRFTPSSSSLMTSLSDLHPFLPFLSSISPAPSSLVLILLSFFCSATPSSALPYFLHNLSDFMWPADTDTRTWPIFT